MPPLGSKKKPNAGKPARKAASRTGLQTDSIAAAAGEPYIAGGLAATSVTALPVPPSQLASKPNSTGVTPATGPSNFQPQLTRKERRQAEKLARRQEIETQVPEVIITGADFEDKRGVEVDTRAKAREIDTRLLREPLAKANDASKPLSTPPGIRGPNAQDLTAELEATKAYLEQSEEQTTAYILSMVGEINAQIATTATSVNDYYKSSRKIQHWDLYDDEEFYDMQRDVVKSYLGNWIYEANTQIDETLYYYDPETPDNSLPLQTSLQHILVSWSTLVTDRFDSAGCAAEAFADLYNLIRQREEPKVVTQWRAATLSALETRRTSYIDMLVPIFQALLLVSGTSTEDAGTNFDNFLRPLLVPLENDLLKLKSYIDFGAIYMTSDLEICTSGSGELYIPDDMENVYDDGQESATASDTVLCCVGLGVRGVSIRFDGIAKQLSWTLIKRPEVALVSLIC